MLLQPSPFHKEETEAQRGYITVLHQQVSLLLVIKCLIFHTKDFDVHIADDQGTIILSKGIIQIQFFSKTTLMILGQTDC